VKIRCLKVGDTLQLEVTDEGVGRVAGWSARTEAGSEVASVEVRLTLLLGDVIVIEPVGLTK
jgi:hypothetical protein